MHAPNYALKNGYLICWLPSAPALAQSVRLRDVAEKLRAQGKISGIDDVDLETLDQISGVELVGGEYAEDQIDQVIGSFWSRVKRAAKKVSRVAKKIVRNDAVKAAYNAIKKEVPMPYQATFMAAEAGVRIGTAIAKGSKKAKKIAPAIKATAEGRMTTAKLARVARRAGVNARLAVKAAAAGRSYRLAQSDPKFAAALQLGTEVAMAKRGSKTSARKVAHAAAALENKGKGRSLRVRTSSGRAYHVRVVPA